MGTQVHGLGSVPSRTASPKPFQFWHIHFCFHQLSVKQSVSSLSLYTVSAKGLNNYIPWNRLYTKSTIIQKSSLLENINNLIRILKWTLRFGTRRSLARLTFTSRRLCQSRRSISLTRKSEWLVIRRCSHFIINLMKHFTQTHWSCTV